MKLYELLKAGKKATLESSKGKWYLQYEVDEDERTETLYEVNVEEKETLEEASTVIDINEFGVELIFSDEWIEYDKGYRTNFNMVVNESYNYIYDDGEILCALYDNHKTNTDLLKNFNAFKDEKLAEYIQAKQLLERKLMVFSYLNGANEIDWEDDGSKYCIDYYYNYDEKENVFDIIKIYTTKDNNFVHFHTRDVANKALELYKDEMKKVMEMGKEFGF